MFINSIHILKFRGFQNIKFDLGKNLTVIAGQNGTQKTTLLGILTQPFTISDSSHALYGEKPLSGGNFKSLFSEKFKLSESFDVPQGHEWTLHLNEKDEPEFTIESIRRTSSKSNIRFWKKGDRDKGSGYIQLPVIYLSLSRLFPIGEDSKIDSSKEVKLSKEEYAFYEEWHNKILIIPDVPVTAVDYLASKQKNTLGVSTAFYDWKMNSAGQDNIGKILLAILSFRRLKDKHGAKYKGGILAIDELDATLYPASQLKLIEALRKFSSQLNVQIIFTTHSLGILEKTCEWQSDPKLPGQVNVVYLQKVDAQVKALSNISFENIRDKLNVALSDIIIEKKIVVFTEDAECETFFRCLVKRRANNFSFVDCSLGCDNLIELSRKKVKGFRFPESLTILDGDVSVESSKMKRISTLKNILVLPGVKSPERLVADFLHGLSEGSDLWNEVRPGYTKQLVFKDFPHRDISKNREKAKEWFNSQKKYWGKNCANVINKWVDENQGEVTLFLQQVDTLIDEYKKYL